MDKMQALNPNKTVKKVLLIAFYFPPLDLSGSQRPCGLAKYFPHFGWEPTVLTMRHRGTFPMGIKVIATDYTDRIASVKRLTGFSTSTGIHQQMGIALEKNFNYHSWKSKAIKFFKELIAFPDPEAGWYRHAIESASEFMDKEKMDAIISTSYPVTSHMVAKKLQEKFEVPWIADLRDLWTQNHYYDKYAAVRFFERRLEKKTLSSADALVTISQPLADSLKTMHPGKDVRCVTNGFDSEEFRPVKAVLDKKFSITYTGTLYNGRRDPLMLLEAMAELISERIIDRARTEILFYGPREEWLEGEIDKYGMKDIAKVCGLISREQAIRKQKESQLLLLLLWNDKKEIGVYTGKLFEYLGSRRPILAIGGGNNIVKDLLADTGAGYFAYDKMQLKKIIMQCYREYKGGGEVLYHANGKTEEYSYLSIAGKYSKILNGVIENRITMGMD